MAGELDKFTGKGVAPKTSTSIANDVSVHNAQHKIGGWVLPIDPERRSPRLLALISLIALATIFGQGSSSADESGASFWSPGTFANLAAVPSEPGWSFSATDFHATLMGGAMWRRRTRCRASLGRH